MPTHDIFGNEIKDGEQYFEFPDGDIVHADALEDYIIEKQGATIGTKA